MQVCDLAGTSEVRCVRSWREGGKERVSRLGEVSAVRLTAEQVETVASWSVGGPDLVAVTVFGEAPDYAREWEAGDVLATQGDAHIHVGPSGRIKDVVPGV